MLKEPLSTITIKTLLAVAIFVGVGTIIVGGGLLIGNYGKVSEPIKENIIITNNETKEEIIVEEEIKDETANWKTYQNEEFGFELKYPSQIINRIDHTKNGVSFSYWYYSKEKEIIEKAAEYMKEIPEEGVPVAYNTFTVNVVDNSFQLPIETWIQKYEHCGLRKRTDLDITTVELEKFVLDEIEGIRIKNLGTYPPGAGSVKDKIYLPKDSKIYTIAIIEEAGLFPRTSKCYEEQVNTFNKILSTFKFIEKR